MTGSRNPSFAFRSNPINTIIIMRMPMNTIMRMPLKLRMNIIMIMMTYPRTNMNTAFLKIQLRQCTKRIRS